MLLTLVRLSDATPCTSLSKLESPCTILTTQADLSTAFGDTGDKYGYFDVDFLAELGIVLDNHGKLPDVVL